jgi:hypothetical protein
MRDEQLIKLERDLQKVPGVRDARVVGVDKPSEIHIVSSSTRAPKQLVRDVQSLAAAGYGISIDHRIVSVVQLEETPQESNGTMSIDTPETSDGRPIVESVVFGNKGKNGWVRVRLRWPDGTLTEGLTPFGLDREARAVAAASAVLQALHPRLSESKVQVTIDDVILERTTSRDLVVVQCGITAEEGITMLVGTAFITDDVASAAVNAVLQALNRKLVHLL